MPTNDREARAQGWESLRAFRRDRDHAENWFSEFGPIGIGHVRLIRDLDAEAWFLAPRAEVRKLLGRPSRRAMYEAALNAQPDENIAPRPRSTRHDGR
jgi:hypothetical protein